MKTFCKPLLLVLLTFLVKQNLLAQLTPGELYRKQIQEAMDNGTYPGETCGINTIKRTAQQSQQQQQQQSLVCAPLSAGYGTNGWQPTSGGGCNRDAACDVPAVANNSCNGGKYRIPLAITIFECASWTGDNYNNNLAIGGANSATGFAPLSDFDLNNTLVELNIFYANANIEFFQVKRERIEDCDIYDFHQSTDPGTGVNDAIDDLVETQALDIPNVINLYFIGGLEGDHDCCGIFGFAPFPTGRDYSIMRYPAGISGITLPHELGHYFGLFHTHHTTPTGFTEEDGYPSGALNNSDCLTAGDGICDTWPDPSLGHNCDHTFGSFDGCYTAGCNFDAAGFAAHSHGASTVLSIDPGEGVACPAFPGVSTILEQNIMSYNSLSGCRTGFSYCQYRKIHDVATDNGCRSYLCHSDPEQYFTSAVIGATNSPYQEICVGDPIPSFNAGTSYTGFDGVAYDLDCFDWYLGQNDMKANAMVVGTSTFTPNPAQVDVNTPGVYSFWIAEVNALNDPPCKAEVTIVVQPDPGAASAVVTDTAPTVKNVCYDTDITSLSKGRVIGWWITDTDPITNTVIDAASFTSAKSAATVGGALASPANHIYESTAGTPLNDICLDIDCSLFPNGTSIYATPFVTSSSPVEPAANCRASSVGSPVSVGGNLGSISGLVDFTTAACPIAHSSTPTWSVILTIDSYAGGTNTLNMNVRGNNSCSNAGFLFFGSLANPAAGAVYTYTSADFPSGYDPTQPGSEICMLVWDPGATTGTLEFSLEIVREYAEVPAVPFLMGDFNNCVFGAPFVVICDANLPIELVDFNGALKEDQVLLNWATEVEINNDYFTVERSEDGRDFQLIGKVDGQGNSYAKHQYSLIDPNPVSGTNYYRLSQTDVDGHMSVAGVITVDVLKSIEIEVFPNPIINNALTFSYNTEDKGSLEVAIFDITGKAITNQQLSVDKGSNNKSIELGELPNGVYIMVARQNEKIMTERFTKL